MQAFVTQIAQTAACHSAHHIEGRLTRWLLLCQDRAHSSDLKLTHERIAAMLGVRRAGVTEAAGKLHNEGLIKYHRGHITLLDRAGLEAKSCVCYSIVRKEFDRLVNDNGQAL